MCVCTYDKFMGMVRKTVILYGVFCRYFLFFRIYGWRKYGKENLIKLIILAEISTICVCVCFVIYIQYYSYLEFQNTLCVSINGKHKMRKKKIKILYTELQSEIKLILFNSIWPLLLVIRSFSFLLSYKFSWYLSM